MAFFVAEYEVSGSLTVTVEADTLEEAQRKLADEGVETELCVGCSGYSTIVGGWEVQKDLTLDDINVSPSDLEAKP